MVLISIIKDVNMIVVIVGNFEMSICIVKKMNMILLIIMGIQLQSGIVYMIQQQHILGGVQVQTKKK
jgi:hypothetical protein